MVAIARPSELVVAENRYLGRYIPTYLYQRAERLLMFMVSFTLLSSGTNCLLLIYLHLKRLSKHLDHTIME